MVFKANDFVALADDTASGYVMAVNKSAITWKTTYGEVRTDDASELKANTGIGAYLSGEGPDLIELTENTAAFAVVQGITKNKMFGMTTLEFLGEDFVYEIFLKNYGQQYAIVRPLTEKYPLTEEQYKSWFPSMPQLANAANKTWAITVIDTVYRLIRGRAQLSKSRMFYILKCFGALEAGNYGHNLWATRERATYKPQ